LSRYKPAAYLSSHNQHKYYWLAEKYKLLVKLPFSIVGSVFFLNQQLITWGMRADYGSYIITVYMTTNLHDTKKQIIKEEEKRRRRERRKNIKIN